MLEISKIWQNWAKLGKSNGGGGQSRRRKRRIFPLFVKAKDIDSFGASPQKGRGGRWQRRMVVMVDVQKG